MHGAANQVMDSYYLIGIIFGAINIGLFFWHRYVEKKLRRVTLKDNFWFRTIVLPTVIQPLKEFSEEQTKSLNELWKDVPIDQNHRDACAIYVNKFQSELDVITCKCYVLTVHSEELYHDVVKILDQLEDDVLQFFSPETKNKNITQNIYFETYTKVLSKIMLFHDKEKFTR